jgi:hypothetical protein
VDVVVDVVVVDGVAVAAEAVALDGVTSTVNTSWYFVKHTFPRQKSATKNIYLKNLSNIYFRQPLFRQVGLHGQLTQFIKN